MSRGFTKNKKFHPIKDYKGVRKYRDQSSKFVGIKIARDERAREQLRGAPPNIKICSTCDRSFNINKDKQRGFFDLPQCAECKRNNIPRLRRDGDPKHRFDYSTYSDQELITLKNDIQHNPDWKLSQLPDVDKAKKAIQKEIDSRNLNNRKKRFTSDEHPYDITKADPILEARLDDIFDPIMIMKRGIDTEKIDYDKLEHVAKSEIEYILEREKKLGKGDKVEVTLVSVRPETSREEFNRTSKGDNGSYQYDYKILKHGKVTPFAGTAYGSISMGHVLDMSLELYDVRQLA